MTENQENEQKITLSKEFLAEFASKLQRLPEDERHAFLRSVIEDEEDWILPQSGPSVFNSKLRASMTPRSPQKLDLGAFVLGQAKQTFQLKSGEVTFQPMTGKKRNFLNQKNSTLTHDAIAEELALVVVSLNQHALSAVVDVKGVPIEDLVKARKDEFLQLPELLLMDVLFHYRYFELLQQRLFEVDVMEGFSKPRSDSLGPASSTTVRTGKP